MYSLHKGGFPASHEAKSFAPAADMRQSDDTDTETQRHRDTETQRHRDTDADTDADTETQRRRDTHIQPVVRPVHHNS